jgi:condensin complex subunit 2
LEPDGRFARARSTLLIIQLPTFSNLMHSLDTVYAPSVRKDVSVPFCFICLLHLANERDLSIISKGNLTELTISRNIM